MNSRPNEDLREGVDVLVVGRLPTLEVRSVSENSTAVPLEALPSLLVTEAERETHEPPRDKHERGAAAGVLPTHELRGEAKDVQFHLYPVERRDDRRATSPLGASSP